jgi:hypothetical protein
MCKLAGKYSTETAVSMLTFNMSYHVKQKRSFIEKSMQEYFYTCNMTVDI